MNPNSLVNRTLAEEWAPLAIKQAFVAIDDKYSYAINRADIVARASVVRREIDIYLKIDDQVFATPALPRDWSYIDIKFWAATVAEMHGHWFLLLGGAHANA